MYFDLVFSNIIKSCGYNQVDSRNIEKSLLEYVYYKGNQRGRIVMYPTTLSEGCIFFYQTYGSDNIRTYGCARNDGCNITMFDDEWCSQYSLVDHIQDIARPFRKGTAILIIDEDEYTGWYCEIDTDCNLLKCFTEDKKEFLDGRTYLDNSAVQNGTSDY